VLARIGEVAGVAATTLGGMLNPVNKITCKRQRKLLNGSERKKEVRRIFVLLGISCR